MVLQYWEELEAMQHQMVAKICYTLVSCCCCALELLLLLLELLQATAQLLHGVW